MGACQTPELLEDVPAALAMVESFSAEAGLADLDLLLFPECFLQGYLVTPEYLRRHALDLDSAAFGEILLRLASIPQTLVIGLIERRHERFYNTAAVINRGRLLGTYRKTHLTAGESAFTAGTGYPVFDLNGVRFGINICYDTRFPEPARAVAAQGARVLLVCAQNMMRRRNAERWRPLHHAIRADRVRETGMWLISADVTGQRDEQRIGYGPTSVINPAARVVAQVPALTVGMAVTEVG
ncbi:carbon-nitrogen hydrolase family protein [Jidongwangia harbinensis]|uniref:carbon-nitrogen hydrolase family protein n=1 Tax=Jidongwangia harbinensis TaxID=2878561 RepID=UPI001CD91DB9|nr:carbon-nitrogen hydrolase family protein [Jidongwangia harbinensis]MCA2213517.1 carbon-nitrogen hydrolase family protein [Jidongwangia harbinensis]